MTRHSLTGPWINFDELTHKTGFVKNEILFNIQTGVITPVIFTDNRPFMAYSIDKNNKIIGHGCFRYSGPFAVDTAIIHRMVRDYKTIVGKQPVQPLCTDSIVDWSHTYPYKGALPNGIVDYWEPRSIEQLQGKHWQAMILPFEHSSYDSAESSLIEFVPKRYDENDFFNRYADEYLIRSPSAHYVYGAEFYSEYNQKDFRFPSAALSRLESVNKQQEPSTTINTLSLSSRKRTNELHSVIQRLIEQCANAKSGILWNELRKDVQLKKRRYDSDHLITQIDHLSIQWTSSSGIQQTLKKSSFQTLVSKLRKIGLTG